MTTNRNDARCTEPANYYKLSLFVQMPDPSAPFINNINNNNLIVGILFHRPVAPQRTQLIRC